MLLIHPGYSKCASTTLQAQFSAASSIDFINKPRIFDIDGDQASLDTSWLAGACRSAAEGDTVVVSHEHMLLTGVHPQLGVSIGGIDEAVSLCEQLDAGCDDYMILLVVRRQSHMLASRYLQYLMQGGKLRLKPFLSRLVPSQEPFRYLDYRYTRIIKALDGGKGRVVCFDVRDINTRAYRKKMFSLLGVKLEPVERERNVAVSAIGAALICAINRLLVSRKESLTERTRTRCPYQLWLVMVVSVRKIDNFICSMFGRKDVMPEHIHEELMAYYRDDNIELASQTGIDYRMT